MTPQLIIRVPKTTCLACGAILSAVADPGGKNINLPEPGDAILCLKCGAVSTIDALGNICPLTEEQITAFVGDPEWMMEVGRIVKFVQFVRSIRN